MKYPIFYRVTVDGLERQPDNLDVVVNDVDLFISNTAGELDHLTGKNLEEFTAEIDDDIIRTGDQINDLGNVVSFTVFYKKLFHLILHFSVEQLANEVHFTELVNIAFYFADVATNFTTEEKDKLQNDLTALQDDVTNLQSKIDDFKNAVVDFCAANPTVDCKEILAMTGKLSLDDSMIPSGDLNGFNINNVEDLEDLSGKLKEALEQLEAFGTNFINEQSQDIKDILNEVEDEIRENTQEITEEIRSFSIKEQINYDSIKTDLEGFKDFLEPLYYAFGSFLR